MGVNRWLAGATWLLLVGAGCGGAAERAKAPTPVTTRTPAKPDADEDGGTGTAQPALLAQATLPAAGATRERTLGATGAPLLLPEIEDLMRRAIADGKLPGGVVVVGDRAGVRYLRAFGKRALTPAPEAATVDTIYDLASLTKPLVTATAIAQLEAAGKLSRADRVSAHLPAFARRGKRRITVEQLLVHAGGLPAVTPRRDFEQAREDAVAKLLAVAPERPPGTFLYSDTGYLVLGALVEKVSGMRLDRYAQKHIFSPLSLADTGFGVPAAKRARTAPTEERDERPIRGVVHDPRAYRLGGAAGNAGLFSTATELSVLARLWLRGGEVDGVWVIPRAQVEAFTTGVRLGDTVRTPAWDRDSDYSRLRGTLLSDRAFGHGGFTGTSLWIDPDRDLFVALLSNRVHPEGEGNVIALGGALADAAARGMLPRAPALRCDAPPGHTRTGIDVLRESGYAKLSGASVGLVVNNASRAADGARTADLLQAAPGVTVRALFSPEHGMQARAEGAVGGGRDAATGLPVHSLFGRTRSPTPAMLRGVDTLVFDLQDVGVRFFTYMSTLVKLMEVAAERGLRVVVLDRPNPLGAEVVEGPMLDAGIETFVHYHRLPVRHGMTAGELAMLLRKQRGLDAALEVVWMRGYRRPFMFGDTGLRWWAPSPNLPTLTSVLAYPISALLESTKLSVGRGTDMPFSRVGAPFVDGDAFANALRLPAGVAADACSFTPRAARHRGRPCEGVQLRVTAPREYRAVSAALALATELQRRHADAWDGPAMQRMLGHARSLRAILAGEPPAGIAAEAADPAWDAFLAARSAHLHYPDCGGASR